MDHCLPEGRATVRSLPIELLTQLEVPVLAFQEADVYEIHDARSTGTLLFRNQGSRNDWIWVQAGIEEMYGALRGRLPAKLVVTRSPDEIRVGITLVFFLLLHGCYEGFLCMVYNKLYCFFGYADMQLILGYESGSKGYARISFYIRGAPPLIAFTLRALYTSSH